MSWECFCFSVPMFYLLAFYLLTYFHLLLRVFFPFTHIFLYGLETISLFSVSMGLFLFCFLCSFFFKISYISGIMWYLSFSIWFISLSIPFRSIHVITNGEISVFFYCWVMSHWIYIPHLYLFACPWIPRLFPYLVREPWDISRTCRNSAGSKVPASTLYTFTSTLMGRWELPAGTCLACKATVACFWPHRLEPLLSPNKGHDQDQQGLTTHT